MADITKQDFNDHVACDKYLYLKKFNPKVIKDPSDYDKMIMEEGVEVGKFARQYFGKYKLIDRDRYSNKMCADMTKVYMDANTNAIAEASFIYNDLFCAVDMLLRNPNGGYDIYEVKSSAKYEKKYTYDVAFQYYVLTHAGVKVNDVHVMYLNGKYKKDGPLDMQKLFVCQKVEMTPEIMNQVELEIDIIRQMLNNKKEPTVPAVSGCRNCTAHDECYKHLPENNIWDIANLRTAAKIYNKQGPEYVSFEDILITYQMGLINLNKNQLLQLEYELKNKQRPKEKELREKAYLFSQLYTEEGKEFSEEAFDKAFKRMLDQRLEAKSNGIMELKYGDNLRYIEYESLREYMDTLVYPVYHLDFETTAPAIPNVDGYGPYDPRINQYSLHIQKHKGEKEKDLLHKEYLQDSLYDNTLEVVDRLIEDLDEQGSVVVYTSFENTQLTTLENMMEARGEHDRADKLRAIKARLWDLSKVFENGWIYDKRFKGKYSIKKVLPVMSPAHDSAYHDLPLVHNGTEDMYWFNKLVTTKPGTNEHEEIRQGLLIYCGLDTLAEYATLEQVHLDLDNYEKTFVIGKSK